MKKLKILSIFAIVAALFVGCSDKKEETTNDLKDGTYYATGEVASNGWMNYLEFDVKDGKISSVDYDAYNMQTGDARTKTQMSEAGEYKLADNATAPLHEQYKAIEDAIVDGTDITTIKFDDEGASDAISGATIKYGEIVDLYKTALENGPITKGSTDKDGYYFGQAAVDAKGNTAQMAYIIYNGKIVAAHADGSVPQEDGSVAYKSALAIDGEYKLADSAIAPMNEQLTAVGEYVVKNQGFEVELNDEGKTDAISGATISVNGYAEAFKNATLVK